MSAMNVDMGLTINITTPAPGNSTGGTSQFINQLIPAICQVFFVILLGFLMGQFKVSKLIDLESRVSYRYDNGLQIPKQLTFIFFAATNIPV